MVTPPPGLVVTFYSFKGGVGRSFALIDVAIYLARSGKRVLCVDWDLEAPGLEEYLRPWLGSVTDSGLLEVFEGVRDGASSPATPQGEVVTVDGCGDRLRLVRAGTAGPDYARRLQALDWEQLWSKGLLERLDRMRTEWCRGHDLVLIDSRTGLSDTGAICTIVMPEVLVAMFTPNEQSYAGVKDVIERARSQQARLGLDRPRMRVVPVLSRLENAEYTDKLAWQRRVIAEMGHYAAAWDPEMETPASVLESIMVPYVPYFAYGERLAALVDAPTSVGTVGRAHAALAGLLERGLMGEAGTAVPEPAPESGGRSTVYVGPVFSRLTTEVALFLRKRGFNAVTVFEEPVPKFPGMTRKRHVAETTAQLERTMAAAVEAVDEAAAIVYLKEQHYLETPETLAIVERVRRDDSTPFIALQLGGTLAPAEPPFTILDEYFPLAATEWTANVGEHLVTALAAHAVPRSLA